MVIDRSLNYGRHIVADYLSSIKPYQVVVDLGAGLGNDLFIARQLVPNCHAYAIEAYKPYVEALELRGITTFSLNIERDSYPFENQSVDVIISNQIIEHIKEIFWVFHEISRVLSVGGHWIIGVPNLASLHNRLLLLAGKQPSSLKNSSAHVRGFTKGDLLNLLDKAFPNGFRMVKFQGSNFYPFPPQLARPLARVFPSFAWSIFLLLQKTKDYHGEFLRYPIENRLETNFYLGES